MTAESLAALAGLILSLAFSYIPGLSSWYAALPGEYKRLTMLAAVIVAGLASFGLACAGLGDLAGVTLTCDQPGAMAALRAVIACLITNQATFLISPQKSR